MKCLGKGCVTRFAPSLTGDLHFGNARVALLNWFISVKSGGRFILRFEDSNLINKNKNYTIFNMLKVLRCLGIKWDAGPLLKNESVYLQSNRRYVYIKYLKKLSLLNKLFVKRGAVWVLTNKRLEFFFTNYLLKIKTPARCFNFVIFRNVGTPVFNFVNPIDDIDMGVNFIIRGEDHIENTKKHVNFFYFFNLKLPKFIHVPLIFFNGVTRGLKMSKRLRTYSLESFFKKNYIRKTIKELLLYQESGEGVKPLFNLLKNKERVTVDFNKLKSLNKGILGKSTFKDVFFYTLNCLKTNKRSLLKEVCKKLKSMGFLKKKSSYLSFSTPTLTLPVSFKPCFICIKLLILNKKLNPLLNKKNLFNFIKFNLKSNKKKGLTLFTRFIVFESLKGLGVGFLFFFKNKNLFNLNFKNRLKNFFNEYTRVVTKKTF